MNNTHEVVLILVKLQAKLATLLIFSLLKLQVNGIVTNCTKHDLIIFNFGEWKKYFVETDKIGLFQKKNGCCLALGTYYFFETPWNFKVSYTLPLEIPEKTKLHP